MFEPGPQQEPTPSLDGEGKRIQDRVDENCILLVSGWKEKVEHVTPVVYHRDTCGKKRGTACECPVVNEKRTVRTQRPGLIRQLKDFGGCKDTDREPKAERGAPRVKVAGKPPGDMAGFLCLDEIACEAYALLDRVFEEAGRDRLYAAQALPLVLGGLAYQVGQFVGEHPGLGHDVMKATDRWVGMARRALRLVVSDAMLDSVVCGTCNGALAVAWDNSSSVRCVGTPSLPPCGTEYPRGQWIALFEQGRRK